MEANKVLRQEHQNILRMLEVIKKLALSYLDGNDFDPDDILSITNFVKEYADSYHHGKEEKILFRIMKEELGPTAEKLINTGMLVEHDLGRYYNKSLKEAAIAYGENRTKDKGLEVLTYALAYRDLLTRHIQKEDDVVYAFAERSLNDSAKAKAEKESLDFESEQNGVNNEYLELLENLEKKYS